MPDRDDGRDDAQLDALLAGAWDDGAAVLATVLDLEAGQVALLPGPAGRHVSGEIEPPSDTGKENTPVKKLLGTRSIRANPASREVPHTDGEGRPKSPPAHATTCRCGCGRVTIWPWPSPKGGHCPPAPRLPGP